MIFASFSSKIFNLLTICWPVFIAGFILQSDYIIFKNIFLNFEYGFSLDSYNKFICLAFSITTLSANLFSLGKKSTNYKKTLIIGNIYYSASLGCILAIDWLSMFCCLEIMMITASMLIFMKGGEKNINLARQYLLTHLFSGSLMLIAIIYLLNTGNTKIVMLAHITIDFYIYWLMLFGCLINTAAFPFSFWLINCYPHASRDGLVYLINFTTKASLLLIIKLFRGEQTLAIFGVVTMIYGIIYAIKENNIRRLLCFLSLIQIGFMLIGTSIDDEFAIKSLIIYISIHILYKCLLAICSGIYADSSVLHCFELKKTDSMLLKISLVIAIFSMMSFPLTLIFYAKVSMLIGLKNNFAAFISYLPTILLCIILPIREYINSSQQITIILDIYTKLSLLLLCIALVGLNISPMINYWGGSFTHSPYVSNYALIKQSMIILSSIFIYCICKQYVRNKFAKDLIVKKGFIYILMISNKGFIKIKLLRQRLNDYLVSIIKHHSNKIQNYKLQINVLETSICGTFILLIILLLTLHRG